MGRNVNCIVEIQKDSKFAVSISKKKKKREEKRNKKKKNKKKKNAINEDAVKYKGTKVHWYTKAVQMQRDAYKQKTDLNKKNNQLINKRNYIKVNH